MKLDVSSSFHSLDSRLVLVSPDEAGKGVGPQQASSPPQHAILPSRRGEPTDEGGARLQEETQGGTFGQGGRDEEEGRGGRS